MGTICKPSQYSSRDVEATALIQCINGQGKRIHELCCIGLDGISLKIHPTAREEAPAGTVG